MHRLVAEEMAVQFGMRRVLSGAFIQIVTGEVAGLVGLNGSGKSTLLNTLFGTLPHARGSVHIDGAYVPRVERWKRIALLSQESFLPRAMRLRKAAHLFAGASGLSSLQSDERTRVVIDTNVGSLSSGERRYAEFLLVLSLQRTFVLLDEPFAQIEPLFVERMLDVIRASTDTSFLLTDQNYRDVCRACDRMMVVADGRIEEVESHDSALRDAGYLPKTEDRY